MATETTNKTMVYTYHCPRCKENFFAFEGNKEKWNVVPWKSEQIGDMAAAKPVAFGIVDNLSNDIFGAPSAMIKKYLDANTSGIYECDDITSAIAENTSPNEE